MATEPFHPAARAEGGGGAPRLGQQDARQGNARNGACGGGPGPRESGSTGTAGKGLCSQSKGHCSSSWGTSWLDRSGTSKGRAWGWKGRWEPTRGARGTDTPRPQHRTAPGELPGLAQEDSGCWQRTAQPPGTQGHEALMQGRPRLKQPLFICAKVSGSLRIKATRKMVKRLRWAKHRAGPRDSACGTRGQAPCPPSVPGVWRGEQPLICGNGNA